MAVSTTGKRRTESNNKEAPYLQPPSLDSAQEYKTPSQLYLRPFLYIIKSTIVNTISSCKHVVLIELKLFGGLIWHLQGLLIQPRWQYYRNLYIDKQKYNR
jgi:hypothetical protein